MKRESHRLGSTDDYRLKTEVEDLCHRYMARINLTSSTPEAGASIGDFVEKTYFPKIERRLAQSTVAGYKKGWQTHLKHRMAAKRVRDFRPCDAQAVLDALEAEHGQKLCHRTYAWLKVTMAAIFAQAVRDGLRDFNPIRNLLTPKGRSTVARLTLIPWTKSRSTSRCSLEMETLLSLGDHSKPAINGHLKTGHSETYLGH